MKKEVHFDKFFFGIIITLLLVGLFIFVSASLGILAKNTEKFYQVLFSQLVLGFGLGGIGMYVSSRINYKVWRKYAFYIFIASILITAAVFIPGLGFSHGGARRWLDIGPVSFQPAELLKICFVIYFAGWLSWVKGKVTDFRFGILPLLFLLGIIALVLFKQPDTKSFILMAISAFSMLIVAGVKWKQITIAGVIIVGGLICLSFFTPYLKDRVKTFIDQNRDPSGSSYQLQQSLIAIGSGGITGRGFGQSIQKFSYLPEPQGDSIFAVVGEEFGFIGSTLLIALYVAFASRGLRIANNAPDQFSQLLVTGLIILLTAQSFMNIASITGLFPLTGVPLVFVSQGGTSLMFALFAIGIILQVSRHQGKVSTTPKA